MAETPHLSILSIDDEPDEHVLLERLLARIERFDTSIEPVTDVATARRRIAMREHDVYLVDHRLVGCSGLDLISEALEAGNPGPFILRTGSVEPGLDVASIRMGAVDYLTKDAHDPATIERSLLLAVERSRTIAAERATQEALEKSLIEKGEFLATITHELRSPLTNVIGFAQILSDPGIDLEPEERDEMLARIVEEGHEISSLVEDLLASARNEVGQLTVLHTMVDVDLETTQVLAALTPDRRTRITYLPGDHVRAFADPARLRQILRNLISNALKYGGPRIEIVTRSDAGRVVLEVRDDGEGLDVTDDGVFDRHRPNPTVAGSNGIGLSLARDLAVLMGGSIHLRREHGWTVFAVELPAQD